MNLQKLSGTYLRQEKILSGSYQQCFSRYEVLTIELLGFGVFFPHSALTFPANLALQIFFLIKKSQLTLAQGLPHCSRI